MQKPEDEGGSSVRLKGIVALVIVFAIVSGAMLGCGAGSAKMNAVKSWVKEYAQAYADAARKYVGKTVNDLSNGETPEKAEKLEDQKYPYDHDKTYGDVITGDFELKDNSIVIYFRVPIGKEDKKLAEKITGKDAEEYFAEARVILETDQKNLDYDNLFDAKITKVRVEKPEIVAGED